MVVGQWRGLVGGLDNTLTGTEMPTITAHDHGTAHHSLAGSLLGMAGRGLAPSDGCRGW